MKVDESIYLKFPVIFKEKLKNGEIEFPDDTEFEYNNIIVYRCIEREKNDNSQVSILDFKSYAELGKRPKRAQDSNLTKNTNYYGVSFYRKKACIENIMHFPNPHKKMAKGAIYSTGGPQQTNKSTEHVCWWMYEDVNIYEFVIK